MRDHPFNTLIESCRRRAIDPYAYLSDVLKHHNTGMPKRLARLFSSRPGTDPMQHSRPSSTASSEKVLVVLFI